MKVMLREDGYLPENEIEGFKKQNNGTIICSNRGGDDYSQAGTPTYLVHPPGRDRHDRMRGAVSD